MPDFLKLFLNRRLRKVKASGGSDPWLEDFLSRPWDGRIESLPHFRGCQVFPASHGVDEMKCTCGITTLAESRMRSLPRFLALRSAMHARYLRMFFHPVQRWRSCREKRTPLSQFFRELAKDFLFAIRAANRLFCLTDQSRPQTHEPSHRSSCGKQVGGRVAGTGQPIPKEH